MDGTTNWVGLMEVGRIILNDQRSFMAKYEQIRSDGASVLDFCSSLDLISFFYSAANDTQRVQIVINFVGLFFLLPSGLKDSWGTVRSTAAGTNLNQTTR